MRIISMRLTDLRMRRSYLRLARVALVAGHADLVEEAMEALNDRRDLL